MNDATDGAIIKMACIGPVFPGKTGHPLDGQTVKALPVTKPLPAGAGYTGTAATEIGVAFGLSTGPLPTVVLTKWAVAGKIPTSLVLPCFGTGTVDFVPIPGSPTAQTATVQVNYVGLPQIARPPTDVRRGSASQDPLRRGVSNGLQPTTADAICRKWVVVMILLWRIRRPPVGMRT